jgi:hypothetical protein
MLVMEVSGRLTRWIYGEFPKGSSEKVLEGLRDLPEGVIGGQDPSESRLRW